MKQYVIARSYTKRPTLMHKLAGYQMTVCGRDIHGWSVAYLTDPIPQVLCKQCVPNQGTVTQ